MVTSPTNPYFCPKSGKHDAIFISFTVDLSKLASFTLVGKCKIIHRECTWNLMPIRLWLCGILRKKTKRGRQKPVSPPPPRSHGIRRAFLGISQCTTLFRVPVGTFVLEYALILILFNISPVLWTFCEVHSWLTLSKLCIACCFHPFIRNDLISWHVNSV